MIWENKVIRMEDERSCDRCGREIHDLEPAATITLGGAFNVEELIICLDCGDVLMDWWEDTDGEGE